MSHARNFVCFSCYGPIAVTCLTLKKEIRKIIKAVKTTLILNKIFTCQMKISN